MNADLICAHPRSFAATLGVFCGLFTLEVFADELHHVRDLLRRHLVFERRHCFLAVCDHLVDLIVSVLDGVFCL